MDFVFALEIAEADGQPHVGIAGQWPNLESVVVGPGNIELYQAQGREEAGFPPRFVRLDDLEFQDAPTVDRAVKAGV